MADIAKRATGIRVVRGGFGDGNQLEGYAGVDLAAGDAAIIDGASGDFVLADATVAGTAGVVGIAASRARAGQGVTLLYNGEMDGFDLSGLAFGAGVLLSETPGALADTAPTTAGAVTVRVGKVVKVGPDKVLKVEVFG
jgi:hypothetical protein